MALIEHQKKVKSFRELFAEYAAKKLPEPGTEYYLGQWRATVEEHPLKCLRRRHDTDRIRINGGNWFDGNGDVVLTADDFIFL